MKPTQKCVCLTELNTKKHEWCYSTVVHRYHLKLEIERHHVEISEFRYNKSHASTKQKLYSSYHKVSRGTDGGRCQVDLRVTSWQLLQWLPHIRGILTTFALNSFLLMLIGILIILFIIHYLKVYVWFSFKQQMIEFQWILVTK